MNTFCETSASRAYFHILFPSAKNKADKQKSYEQSKGALKAAPEPGMRSDGYRKERSQVSLPGRSPTDARTFPPSQWKSGARACGGKRCSFISDGYRFYNFRMTCWFFAPSQAHTRRRARMQAEYFHHSSRHRAVTWASAQWRKGCMFLRWLR